MAKEKEEEKGTDVATASETALAPVELFEQSSGAGLDGMSQDDLVVPFIKLLQKTSDEVDKDHASFIEGADPGMFLDAATREIFEEVQFIVCHYHRAIVEWRDREAGGGFIAQYPVGHETGFERELRAGKWTGRWRASDETHLVDTRYFFGLRLTADGSAVPGVMSFSSTQIKKARSWVTRLRSLTAEGKDGQKFQLPIFASIWDLTSVAEKNDQGGWSGYKIEPAGVIEDPKLAQMAKEARDMFSATASQFSPAEDGKKTDDDGNDLPF